MPFDGFAPHEPYSEHPVVTVLRTARRSLGLSGENWSQRFFNAWWGGYCAVRAVERAVREVYRDQALSIAAYLTIRNTALAHLHLSLPKERMFAGDEPTAWERAIIVYNDDDRTIFDDVRSLFDRAIEHATLSERQPITV